MTSLRRKAGEVLGFDLAGLFKDDDNLEGSDLSPFFQVSSNVKGRGGALSYKAPKQPSRVGTFGLEPTRLAGEGPLQVEISQKQEQTQAAPTPGPTPTPAPEPEPTPEPEKPSYTYTDPGDVGYFGMKDYEELAGQGAPMSLIKEYAQKAPYGVGPDAARLLGMQPYTETQGRTTQFPVTSAKTIQYTDPGDKGYFGMQDYNELLNQGASQSLIKEYASKAPMGVGPEAARLLNLPVTTQMPTTTTSQSASRMSSLPSNIQDMFKNIEALKQQSRPTPAPAPQKTYTYTDPGDKGYFGKMDYEELARQGASRDVIRDYARRAPLGVGNWAKAVLGL